MASNGVRASSVASSTGSSFVDASGYKFSKDDQKLGKVKVKKVPKKKGADAARTENAASRSPSPILPDMDDATHAAFPDGKPRDGALETVICKHCKRPVLKKNSKDHIFACIRSKQEKARKKKEAREAAAKAKEKAERGDTAEKDEDAKGVPDDDSEIKVEPVKLGGARKSAVKTSKDDDNKKGKKRKAAVDEEDKEPKKKKKKDEQKPKAPKPKGPVDVEKQCGVILPNGAQCARSLTCKTHSMGAKRAVPGRSLPYDMLLQAYQKKNQARQQKAAIDANAPQNLSDSEMLDQAYGAVDSDEERDSVMTALRRSLAYPQPLAQHVLFPQKKKYQLIRMKEILGNALVGNRAGVGLFSVVEQPAARDNSIFAVPTMASGNAGMNPTVEMNGGAAAGMVGGGGDNANMMAANNSGVRKPSGSAAGHQKVRKPSVASSVASTAAGD